MLINKNIPIYLSSKIYIFKFKVVKNQRIQILQNMNMQSENQQQSQVYQESRYRWVVVALMSLAFVINALANNAIIPITHKLSETYELSDTKVYAPIFLSFLVYSLMNFPANHFIDKKGLKFSLIIGTFLYALGLFFFALINVSYNFVIFGAILIALGQPFVINCPAKVAAFWFTQQNRTFSTGIMMGFNIIATGVGFAVPTLVVKEDSEPQASKQNTKSLYIGYCVVASSVFVLQLIFMKAKPEIPASNSADENKISVMQSFRMIKASKNLQRFFTAYILLYGSFLTSGAITNQLLKPYGYEDTQIAILGVLTIVGGVVGTIVFTTYLKKHQNHAKLIKQILWFSIILIILYSIWLNTFAIFWVTAILALILGFIFAPIIPISYDLGCQLAYPVGEAQIVGILNGGSMILTFFLTLLLSNFLGFGTKKQSAIFFLLFNVTIIIGAQKYSRVDIELKRTEFENKSKNQKQMVKYPVTGFVIGGEPDKNQAKSGYEVMNEEN